VSETVEPTRVLTYAEPQRRRLRNFWAGIICFYAIMMTFAHGVPLFEAGYASNQAIFANLRNPGFWFVERLIGSVKGILLIWTAVAIANTQRRAIKLALAYLALECLFIGVNVGSYILDTYSLRPTFSLKVWLSTLNPEVMLELFTPLALAAAMFVLLLYWERDPVE
jgi:hypothetical protein